MKKLQIKRNGLTLYSAGSGYLGNFTRDGIISGILSSSTKILKDQLIFSATLQGKEKNNVNGEEPGKIHHEYPCAWIGNLSTQYNACDATALFLIGHLMYQKLSHDDKLAKKQRSEIENATSYIIRHLHHNYLFIEAPQFCEAKRFALKTTYWKDSEIINRKNGMPDYPIIYTLAHAQNLAGLRAAAKLMNVSFLDSLIEKMKTGLESLYVEKMGTLCIGHDKAGPIHQISSDSLHALFYLEEGDLAKDQIQSIEASSTPLETPIGYRTLTAQAAEEVEDKYHASTVWPFEQAIINSAAKRFGLKRAEMISSRITGKLDTDPELFYIKGSRFIKSASDPQLWTWAAKKYFQRPKMIELQSNIR